MNKDKTKKFKWSAPYEAPIIQVWGDHISDLRGQKRNGHVLQKMTEELATYGCVVTPLELKNKLHNLTTKYKKEKDKIGPSGGGRSDWVYYDQVHEVLDRYKIHNINMCMEESIPSTSHVQPVLSESSPSDELMEYDFIESSSPSGSTTMSPVVEDSAKSTPSTVDCEPKVKRNNFQLKLLKKFDQLEVDIKDQGDKMRQVDQELLSVEKEKNEIVKDYLQEFKDLKTAFIGFLERN